MRHVDDSAYCYYHDKLASGFLETDVKELYPVWPLPPGGYVILGE